jgi:hypothetical protein
MHNYVYVDFSRPPLALQNQNLSVLFLVFYFWKNFLGYFGVEGVGSGGQYIHKCA